MLIPRLTRELWELDPWAQMRMMEREMENLFSRYEGWEEEFPALNVYIGAEDALVTAELPGFDSKDFDVSVVGGTLTLAGNRLETTLSDEYRFLREERFKGRFSRTLELPFRADPDRVDATYERGILRIRIPRLEGDKPRQIPVKMSEESSKIPPASGAAK